MSPQYKPPEEKTIKRIFSTLMRKVEANEFKGKSFNDYDEFKHWYLKQYESPKCYYCGIPEDRIKEIYWDIRETKRPPTRIRLELDRKNPNDNYNADSVVLACFVCNNAKSDIFLAEEFMPIGREIEKVWKKIEKENANEKLER
jgi:hypothetical protein